MLFRHEPLLGALPARGTIVTIIPDFNLKASSTGEPSIRILGLWGSIPLAFRQNLPVSVTGDFVGFAGVFLFARPDGRLLL